MMKIQDKKQLVLLSGNQAIARGALEAGVGVVASYPGTPATQITETLINVAKEKNIYVEWSINEKVAFEVVLGASMVGNRSFVSMKNAGLNLILDPLILATYSGIKAGLVILVSDDPAAHFSASEQDSRGLAYYLNLPCLEPANPQEALTITKKAFEISESLELPVLVKVLTRVSFSNQPVKLGLIQKGNKKIGFNRHYKREYCWNNYAPPRPSKKHRWLMETIAQQKKISEQIFFNKLIINHKKISIITSGIASEYVQEVLRQDKLLDKINFLKTIFINPLPQKQVLNLLNHSKEVLVIEEGEPVVEDQVRLLAQANNIKIKIFGKRFNKILECFGELNIEKIRKVIFDKFNKSIEIDKKREKIKSKIKNLIFPRTHMFCPGCPHLGTHWSLKEALKKEKIRLINGDVGCYELAGFGLNIKNQRANNFADKYYSSEIISELIDTLYCMGSGSALAQGQKRAGYKGKIVALSGDSTFFHSSLPPLINAFHNQTPLTLIIFDNKSTAMTGHQSHPGNSINIENIVKSLGIKFIKVIDAYNFIENVKIIKQALNFQGVSVIISKKECVLAVNRKKKKKKRFQLSKIFIDSKKCVGCKKCLSLGCQAIKFDQKIHRAKIDLNLCCDCKMCVKICSRKAIKI